MELIKLRIEDSGMVPELRKRLIAYIKQNPTLYKDKPADGAEYKEELDKTTDEVKHANEMMYLFRAENASTPTEVNPPVDPGAMTARNKQTMFAMPELNNAAKILDQMRKWNCHYDGRDVYGFLERANELKKAYEFSDAQVIKGFPELLRGEALLWYRNEAKEINNWRTLEKALRDFFLSTEERRNLNRQIHERHILN